MSIPSNLIPVFDEYYPDIWEELSDHPKDVIIWFVGRIEDLKKENEELKKKYKEESHEWN